jgi:hypothetical protein
MYGTQSLIDFKSLLTSENRCVVFECARDLAADKWSKLPRNGFTQKLYHDESDLYSYAVCMESTRRYSHGSFYKGLVGVRTGKLSSGLHLFCFDFDRQRSKENGAYSDYAKDAARYFNSYTEQSVSGEGCHIFMLSELPYLDHVGKIDHKHGEVYWAGQSIAMTGNLVSFDDWSSPETICVDTDKVIAWCEKFGIKPALTHQQTPKQKPIGTQPVFIEDDDTVLDHMYTEKAGDKIQQLFEVGNAGTDFEHRSNAIAYLACKLAFHTGRNVPQMMRLIKLSAVWASYGKSDKWLEDTCNNACQHTTATRKPKAPTAEQVYLDFVAKQRARKKV